MANSKFSLSGQCVVITGGLGILGRHMALGFLDAGATVALIDMMDDTPARTREMFGEQAESGRIRGFAFRIGSEADNAGITEEIAGAMGPIHHLLNNAASKGPDLLRFMAGPDDMDAEVWNAVMDVNLSGAFFLSQAMAAHMREHGATASMTFVSSIYGSIAPNPSLYASSNYMGTQINTPPIYSASKGGVVSLSRYLAGYWGRNGIRVNTLTPGGVQSGQNDAFVSQYEARTPLGRMGRVEDLVGPAVFLASPAAGYITGTNLFVDGGFSCW
ncbi:SDR family oxidoreductase [uncultured Algimonas sp.]|uniref:SDR family NAD(P)-dependent oxidoreductase n=1 Tax=uncultured Algimonas sp. TaxID=1547920 RepID=UPI00260B472A|nr:SDR family oxidoreductase [uncultured Algimonas sp.]